jgi:hypothetical protein
MNSTDMLVYYLPVLLLYMTRLRAEGPRIRFPERATYFRLLQPTEALEITQLPIQLKPAEPYPE